METEYLNFLVKEMDSMFDGIPDPYDWRLLMAGTMTRLLNCDSLLDLATTHGINQNDLYQALDTITPPRWLRRLVKRGRLKLAAHLRKWHAGDPSYKSRHFITLCADDCTRSARGDLGGWTGIFYSGAMKKVVLGINVEALCAVIGDGLDVIILDVRIFPPIPKGSGRHPLNLNQWLRGSLRNLSTFLKTKGTNLEGCPLSVDSAYVSPENISQIEDLGMHMVSKLSANRIVKGDVGGPITSKVASFAGLAIFVEHHRCRDLRGEVGVEFQRNTVHVPSLKRDALMVTFLYERDFLVYFTTKLNMKTITLRNILRYRWQLERIFWILKQDIGIGDIHNHKENRVETRIYLHIILAQVIREASVVFKCSPKDIVRKIRSRPDKVMYELGFQSAFASENPLKPVLQVRHAA